MPPAEPRFIGQPPSALGSPQSAPGGDPFDLRLAGCATLRIPVARIVDLLHAPHDPARIAKYRLEMQNGERFPPIAVVRIGRYYLVADGHKRFQAYLGLSERPQLMVVEYWPWRRWLMDQNEQLQRKLSQLGRALAGGPPGWRLLLTLFVATLRHWWRVVYSLSTLYGARRRLERQGR